MLNAVSVPEPISILQTFSDVILERFTPDASKWPSYGAEALMHWMEDWFTAAKEPWS